MSEIEIFRSDIDRIIQKAADELNSERALLDAKKQQFEDMLSRFDSHADLLQENIITPRLDYLASLFENSNHPEYREEENYRHRSILRFMHTEEFPCMADITVLIVHCNVPNFLKVKYDYMILPAYLTERYKFSDEIQIPMDEKSYSSVGIFLQTCIETFLTSYLKIRRI